MVLFRLAKPIYESLIKIYPRWENQPLVLFRLGTIYDLQNYTDEAEAVYGLLVDLYPEDHFADNARLGLLMTSLRADKMPDVEKQAS